MNRRAFFAKSTAIGAAALLQHHFSHASAKTDPDALLIGCTAAMSGPLAGFGLNMQLGVDAAFAQINAAGGVNGRSLAFQVLDDAYVPAKSVENVKQLLSNSHVVALMSCLGTPNNAAITPVIESAGAVHLAPLTGAASLRNPNVKGVFHIRASYTDEVQRLVKNLVAMGITNLGVAYQDNAYGLELLQNVTQTLATANIRAASQAALKTDGSNTEAVVASLMAGKPAAVLLCTTGAATTGLVSKLRELSPLLPIAGVSASLTQDGVTKLGQLAKGIAITMVYPDPNRAKLQLVREYQAAMAAQNVSALTTGSLEGYVNGRVMAEALKRTGRAGGKDKLRESLSSIRKLDLGGFTVDYGGANARVGSNFVDLGILSASGKYIG